MTKHKAMFKGRKNSAKAWTGLICGAAAFLALMVMALISGLYDMGESMLFGGLGIAFFFLALTGFILAAKSIRERDIYYAVPVTGMIIGGITLVSYFVLYMIGISLI